MAEDRSKLQGGFGAKGGAFRAEPIEATAENEESLYQALTHIGTRRKSIKPGVLREYEVLLGCPQVRSRAGAQSGPDELAEAAARALIEAIELLPDDTDRLVAEAILAVGRFEGKSVGRRKEQVNETPEIGCSPNAFKHRRKRVLTELVRYLFRERTAYVPEPEVALAEAEQDPASKGSMGLRWLNRVAVLAAELKFRAFTARFVAQMHYEFDRRHPYRFPETPETIWNECSKQLFRAYVEFIAGLRYAISSPELRPLPAAILTHLPQRTFDELTDLLERTVLAGPSLARYTETLTLYANGHLGPSDEWVERIFWQEWNPWFYAEVVRHKASRYRWSMQVPAAAALIEEDEHSRPLGVEVLAGQATEVESLIRPHTEYLTPVAANSRRRAMKAISFYFDFDEWLPALNGQSLRDLAESRFEQYEAQFSGALAR